MDLVASGSRTASGTIAIAADLSNVRRAGLILTVSAAGSAAGDLLDVFLQSSIDDGATWDDFVHFTQALGNGGPKKFIAWWTREVVPESEIAAPVDGALAVGVRQGPIGVLIREKHTIVNGGGTHDFTYSIKANLERER